MFDLPDAKRYEHYVSDIHRHTDFYRVRRDQLNGSDSESHHSEDEAVSNVLREKLRAKLASALDFSLESISPSAKDSEPAADAPMKDVDANPEDEEDEPEEFEFRLFASTTAEATKVVLESDKPVNLGEGTVLMPDRPLTYFLAPRSTGKLREKFDFAAVSGDDVMAYAEQRWWGREMPWKIIARIPANSSLTAAQTKIIAQKLPEGTKRKRNRPCKKDRMKKHIKQRTLKAKKEEEEKMMVSKEEHLKEKKKRLNHAKKLRRRAKEKEKKAATAGAAASDAPNSQKDAMSDSE